MCRPIFEKLGWATQRIRWVSLVGYPSLVKEGGVFTFRNFRIFLQMAFFGITALGPQSSFVAARPDVYDLTLFELEGE